MAIHKDESTGDFTCTVCGVRHIERHKLNSHECQPAKCENIGTPSSYDLSTRQVCPNCTSPLVKGQSIDLGRYVLCTHCQWVESEIQP